MSHNLSKAENNLAWLRFHHNCDTNNKILAKAGYTHSTKLSPKGHKKNVSEIWTTKTLEMHPQFSGYATILFDCHTADVHAVLLFFW